jgi:hypothetical protein
VLIARKERTDVYGRNYRAQPLESRNVRYESFNKRIPLLMAPAIKGGRLSKEILRVKVIHPGPLQR